METVKSIIEAGLSLMTPEAREERLGRIVEQGKVPVVDMKEFAALIDECVAAVGVINQSAGVPKIDEILSLVKGAEVLEKHGPELATWMVESYSRMC